MKKTHFILKFLLLLTIIFIGFIAIYFKENTNYFNSFYPQNNKKSEKNITNVFSTANSNQPNDITTSKFGSETIDWILWDSTGPGKYRVWANDTNDNYYIWRNWTNWQNNTNLQISINRSTCGIFNYTIEYNNSIGIFGIPDTVIVKVTEIYRSPMPLLPLLILPPQMADNSFFITFIVLIIVGSIVASSLIISKTIDRKRMSGVNFKNFTNTKLPKDMDLSESEIRDILRESKDQPGLEVTSYKILKKIITKPIRYIPNNIYNRVQNLKNLSEQEKEKLLKDLAMLDEKNMERWLKKVEEMED
ncbi:MAG: hypothetical protein ACFFDN_50875 [Candidatus Hodarchaeota archaeon]